ncbi:MAG: MFS transporter [Betaproteobacteria bacterium]|nr:MFS transporter [Betaproteobacteria bacterium]MDE2056223.1 MFS transporter [Betaproteobacteria bacterium]
MSWLGTKPLSLQRQLLILSMGFASGLPLALTGTTLQAWLVSSGINIKTVGLFAAIGIPYTWKFLWSPFMDKYYIPKIGRRKTWLLLTQVSLLFSINWLSTLSPTTDISQFSMVALCIAFFSASQDIVIDAYRTDILTAPERGMGSAMAVLGYRLAMLLSGAGGLMLASLYGFHTTYQVMSIIMVLIICISLLSPEPITSQPKQNNYSFITPITEFIKRPYASYFLLLVVIYKLSDALAGSLTTAFLIQGVHFSLIEVGVVNKGVGLAATLLGAFIGGALMTRINLYRSLFYFGVLQALATLSFALLAHQGHHAGLMIVSVFLENFTSGMGTAALSALLMSLCHHEFSATQFALLSALTAIGRVYLAPVAGIIVANTGWVNFFLISTIAALPGLMIIWFIRQQLIRLSSSSFSDSIHSKTT